MHRQAKHGIDETSIGHFTHAGEKIAFSDAAALVRLGHKYQLAIARAEGLRLLKGVFTTNTVNPLDKFSIAIDYTPRNAVTAIVLA